MPTLTSFALDTLLVPGVRDSFKYHSESKQPRFNIDHNDVDDKQMQGMLSPSHFYIKPAFYSTPEVAPIPDGSGGSPSQSPYVVNHKQRGGKASFSADQRVNGSHMVTGDGGFDRSDGVAEGGFCGEIGDGNSPAEVEEEEGFVDFRCESIVVGGCTGLDDLEKQLDSVSVVSAQGEFFDADEYLLPSGSVSSASSSGHDIGSELQFLRLRLVEETEKQESLKNALRKMYYQWRGFADALSREGLTFPAPPLDCNSMQQTEYIPIEQFTQEIIVSRFVAEAIDRGLARAEAEFAAEAILELRDQEISRLQARLRYHEVVNHEMSRRNLEISETARRQRQRRKRQLKWLSGGVGLALTIGASLVAYSYLSQKSGDHQSLSSHGSSDASSDTS